MTGRTHHPILQAKCTWIHRFFLLLTPVFVISCATPRTSSKGEVNPDVDPLGGGISSTDIRTVANRMAPSVLGLPEIASREGVTRIAMTPMRNSSRFILDMDLFMKRLRLELNRYGSGRVRFFSQNRGQITRQAVLQGQNENRVEQTLKQLAGEIASHPRFVDSDQPVKIAVLPVVNSNIVNMNADSFLAMLRSHILSQGNENIALLMPGVTEGADYYLTGQFIAESMKPEAIIDLSKYIQIVEQRLAAGKSLSDDEGGDSFEDVNVSVNNTAPTLQRVSVGGDDNGRPSILEVIAANRRLQVPPNVTKRLNVIVSKADTKVSVYEKMFVLEKKVDEGLGRANLILSGEISGLSKRVQGKMSDYLLITIQIVDPQSNEVLWEDGYEFKKQSQAGIVYQ